MGIICASVPVMRSLVKAGFDGSSGDRYGRSYELNQSQNTPSGSRTWRSAAGTTASQADFNKFESVKKQTRTNIFGRTTARVSSESNESQKDIIPPPYKNGVLQRTDFQISYSSPWRHNVDSSAVLYNR